MIKAVKIQETFEDFLESHPEIIPVRDSCGNIEKILFPPNAEQTSFTNVNGNIKLYYLYNGSNHHFPEI